MIIYDSNYGNTKLVADEVGNSIGDNYKVVSTKDFNVSDLNGIDLLIFGSPIVGWRPTESTQAVINSMKEKVAKGLCFTTFDTRVKLFIHGDAKEKMASMLTAAGGKLVFEPQAFYVKGKLGPLFEGELELAAKWAKLVKSKL